MSLEAVLVDRARLVRKADSGVKVGGRTTFVEADPGTWFAARLTMPTTSPEQLPAGFVSKRVVLVPTLVYGTDDDDDNPVELRFNDELDVESDDLGSARWQVTTEPQPFRKRESILGFQVTLKRVEVREFASRA